jgi:hypothetical protein
MSPSRPKGRAFLEVERFEERNTPVGHVLTALAAAAPAPAPATVLTGDFNGDGVLDLATIDGHSAVSVWLGHDGTHQEELRYTVGNLPKSIVAADFRGNGILDLAVANKGSKDVSVLLGQGDGDFDDELRFPVGGTGPDALAVGDFNGDGHLDLAGISFDNQSVFFLLGNGDGTFRGPVPTTGEALGKSSVMQLVTANVANDFLGDSPLGSPPSRPESGGGFNRGQPFFVNGGPCSAAGTVSVSEEEGAVDATGDEQDGAVLLTSFGIPVLLSRTEAPRLPLADVFVVNGPGFNVGVEVFAQTDESPGHRQDFMSSRESGALLQTPAIPPKELRLCPRQDAEERAGAFEAPIDESAASSFRMILDDLFRPDRLAGLPGRTGSSEGAAQPTSAPRPASKGPAEWAPAQSPENVTPHNDVLQEITMELEETQTGPLWVGLLLSGLWLGSLQHAPVRKGGILDRFIVQRSPNIRTE